MRAVARFAKAELVGGRSGPAFYFLKLPVEDRPARTAVVAAPPRDTAPMFYSWGLAALPPVPTHAAIG